MIDKICPLRGWQPCAGDKCAWFVIDYDERDCGRCALASISIAIRQKSNNEVIKFYDLTNEKKL